MALRGSGKGTTVSSDGYLRIKRRGPFRDWYLHRKVMFEACKEFCYYPINGNLPSNMTVEHIDHDKRHNCLCNLLLLDACIHNSISARSQAYRQRAPYWVQCEETGEDAWDEGRE